MRQPLWAINSSLILLCILGQLVFVIIQKPILRRASLEPDSVNLTEHKSTVMVDIKKIYEANDLFATYTPAPTPTYTEPEIPPIPNAPTLIPLSIPAETPRVFIPPLPVTLKGVIYSHDKPTESIAIIQFQNSKEEMNYHVGQLINDAQILKIYPNRVIIVRSNGQKETLYLRESEASKDFNAEIAKEMAALVIPLKSGIYQIPVSTISKQIKNLGQFIDLLNLTTVYKKGKSVGCRIGKAGQDSLASKLGLEKDDIIEQIDTLPITDIASRVLAFDHVLSKNIGDIITVQLERNNIRTILKYELTDDALNTIKAPTKTTTTPVINEQMLYTMEQEKQHMLEQKIKLAPTAHQLEMEERKKMFQARNKKILANTMARG